MILQTQITEVLEQIYRETGIVLSRQSDRDRIERYLERGGEVPLTGVPIPKDLIRLVTTNETYFEREQHHFDYLMDEILPTMDQNDTGRPIRILCAPCSSGEEPYTIAIRIESSQHRFKRRIEILGIDISEEMIEKAKEGVYSPRSVHALSEYVRETYFQADPKGYRIRPFLKSTLSFEAGNLFDPEIWKSIGDFDIIFSRNMMIYFDAQKNRELLMRFHDHLKGYLILGHADDHRQAKELFTPLRTGNGAVYRV